MSILSDFFIADQSEALQYAGGEGVHESDRCQFRRITPLEAAAMLQIFRNAEDRIALLKEFVLISPREAEEWTMTVPHDMVESLASLDAGGTSTLAQKLAAATSEELGWPVGDFESVVVALSQLAQRAIASKKNMYLWNSL